MTEIYSFQVDTPAGTIKANPEITAIAFPPRIVRRIEVVVPPGPQGLVGFQIAMAGRNVIPVNAGQFIVTSNEKIGWDVGGLPDSGAWQVISYNTGVNPHSLFFRFIVESLPKPGPGAQLPIPAELISSPVA